MFAKLLRVAAFLSAAAIATTVAAQDELSGGDKKWMEKEVGAIITEQEASVFQQINKGDRKLFKEIFWMRRDFNPRTSDNEYEDVFKERVKTADDTRDFKTRGVKGSESEMGRLYVLLGTPDRREQARAADLTGLPGVDGGAQGGGPSGSAGEAQPGGAAQEPSSGGGGNSNLMTWVYNANPQSLTPNGLVIEFRRQQNFGFRVINEDEIQSAIEGAKARLIANPGIAYARNSDGRLEKPDDKFDPNSPAKQALAALRQTGTTSDAIAFDVNPIYFEASEGQTFVPIDLVVGEGYSNKSATFFGAVENANGIEIYQFEEPHELKADTHGHRAFEMPMQFLPGLYTLYVGVLDPGTQAVGTQVMDIEVPDFNTAELSISSVLTFTDREAVGEEQPHAGKAFMLAGSHLTPRRTRIYKTTEDLQGIYYAYNFVAEGGPKLSAQYLFFKGEEKRGQTADEPVQLVNEEFAVVPFGFPLSIPNFKDPGEYRVQIKLTDHNTGKVATGDIEFVVEDE